MRFAVERALAVLSDLEPDLLLVSAGFDAYAHDPITQMSLETGGLRAFRPLAARERASGGRDPGRRLQR